jgi:hypothetical protein
MQKERGISLVQFICEWGPQLVRAGKKDALVFICRVKGDQHALNALKRIWVGLQNELGPQGRPNGTHKPS